VPEGIAAADLDGAERAQLRTLPGDLADAVARWLVAASREEDPERAYQYALQARSLAARVGVVRETCGIAAYRAGRWTDALSELRTARRLTGNVSYLPMMADAERALGRLDRALALVEEPGARDADRGTQIELLIVASGIRRDQGRPAAGVAVLQVPELTDGRWRPWSARLFYAYADALLEAGRDDEALNWFGHAAAADRDEETDASERCEDLEGINIEDLDDSDDDLEANAEPAAEPVTGEPVTGEPATAEPVTGELDVHEPGVGEPGDAADDAQPGIVPADGQSGTGEPVGEQSGDAVPDGEQPDGEQPDGEGNDERGEAVADPAAWAGGPGGARP
jgi:tetratricopeptide (TPR) repeat protein